MNHLKPGFIRQLKSTHYTIYGENPPTNKSNFHYALQLMPLGAANQINSQELHNNTQEQQFLQLK